MLQRLSSPLGTGPLCLCVSCEYDWIVQQHKKKCPTPCTNFLFLKRQKLWSTTKMDNSHFLPASRRFSLLSSRLFPLLYLIISCASLPTLSFPFIPTGIRAANSCQTDALIQSASRLSPRPSLILSINNPADSSIFFSNKEMDYTGRLKANKLPSLRLPLADSHWPPNEWMRRICHRCLC